MTQCPKCGKTVELKSEITPEDEFVVKAEWEFRKLPKRQKLELAGIGEMYLKGETPLSAYFADSKRQINKLWEKGWVKNPWDEGYPIPPTDKAIAVFETYGIDRIRRIIDSIREDLENEE